MTFFQWKKFHFFDLKKEVDNGAIVGQIQEDNVVTCVTSGRGFICLGDLKVRYYLIEKIITFCFSGKYVESDKTSERNSDR